MSKQDPAQQKEEQRQATIERLAKSREVLERRRAAATNLTSENSNKQQIAERQKAVEEAAKEALKRAGKNPLQNDSEQISPQEEVRKKAEAERIKKLEEEREKSEARAKQAEQKRQEEAQRKAEAAKKAAGEKRTPSAGQGNSRRVPGNEGSASRQNRFGTRPPQAASQNVARGVAVAPNEQTIPAAFSGSLANVVSVEDAVENMDEATRALFEDDQEATFSTEARTPSGQASTPQSLTSEISTPALQEADEQTKANGTFPASFSTSIVQQQSPTLSEDTATEAEQKMAEEGLFGNLAAPNSAVPASASENASAGYQGDDSDFGVLERMLNSENNITAEQARAEIDDVLKVGSLPTSLSSSVKSNAPAPNVPIQSIYPSLDDLPVPKQDSAVAIISDPAGAKAGYDAVVKVLGNSNLTNEQRAEEIRGLLESGSKDTAFQAMASAALGLLEAPQDPQNPSIKDKVRDSLLDRFKFLEDDKPRDEKETEAKTLEALGHVLQSCGASAGIAQSISDRVGARLRDGLNDQRSQAQDDQRQAQVLDQNLDQDQRQPGASEEEVRRRKEIQQQPAQSDENQVTINTDAREKNDNKNIAKTILVAGLKAGVAAGMAFGIPVIGIFVAIAFLYLTRNLGVDNPEEAKKEYEAMPEKSQDLVQGYRKQFGMETPDYEKEVLAEREEGKRGKIDDRQEGSALHEATEKAAADMQQGLEARAVDLGSAAQGLAGLSSHSAQQPQQPQAQTPTQTDERDGVAIDLDQIDVGLAEVASPATAMEAAARQVARGINPSSVAHGNEEHAATAAAAAEGHGTQGKQQGGASVEQ